jgi:Tfp pilus assembly protein PilV
MKPTTYNLQPTTNPKGFSFLEVMLSVFLLVMGLMAAVMLLGKSLKEATDSRNQLVAELLAQEGAELVKNVRDTNLVNKVASFQSFPAGNTNCSVSVSTALNCSTPTYPLYYNSTNLTYSHTAAGGTVTKFLRRVNITAAGSGTSATETITSMVIWSGATFPATAATCGTGGKCAYAQVTLTKWGE